jgi:hypothetical protein
MRGLSPGKCRMPNAASRVFIPGTIRNWPLSRPSNVSRTMNFYGHLRYRQRVRAVLRRPGLVQRLDHRRIERPRAHHLHANVLRSELHTQNVRCSEQRMLRGAVSRVTEHAGQRGRFRPFLSSNRPRLSYFTKRSTNALTAAGSKGLSRRSFGTRSRNSLAAGVNAPPVMNTMRSAQRVPRASSSR